MDIPSYLLKLLESEIKDIQIELVKKISDKYNLCFDNIYREFIENSSLKVLPDKNEKVIIYKKQKSRVLPDDVNRCIANIWGRGNGGRCSRKMVNEHTKLCKQHSNGLKHGTIYDTTNKNKNNNKVLYK